MDEKAVNAVGFGLTDGLVRKVLGVGDKPDALGMPGVDVLQYARQLLAPRRPRKPQDDDDSSLLCPSFHGAKYTIFHIVLIR